jgi:small multidrug resistance family-3 protein
VNVNRAVDFGRLMGLYTAVFFVVSQLMSLALFGERPLPSLLLGGALIVAGGLVIQLGQ